MDMKMNAEEISVSSHPVWDVNVTDGIVPILTGDEEMIQRATIAGFLESGSVPQLPDVGVPWQNFLIDEITFGDLDAAIRGSIMDCGATDYYPDYSIDDDKLKMTIGMK